VNDFRLPWSLYVMFLCGSSGWKDWPTLNLIQNKVGKREAESARVRGAD
jgi:hypothetical protein